MDWRSRQQFSAVMLRPVWQALLVLALCGLIYWTGIGSSGFSSTEGHRAIPAWEMVERGDWTTTTLFERPYLRKPPGMPWAIAVSSMMLGETEFAARAVSAAAATLAALAVLAFGRRWFGPVGGLAAGLAQALMPRWWSPGRSAEIEMLNSFGTLLALLALADLLLTNRGSRPLMSCLAALGVVIAGLAKGPASVPAVIALLAGAVIVHRTASAALRPAVLLALGTGSGIVVGVLALLAVRSQPSAQTPVVQSVTEFLWRPGQAWDVLAMPFVAIASALPGSLALLFPWGPDARDEGGPGRTVSHIEAYRIAQALSWACLLGLAILLVIGVNNPRYAMPVLTPIAPVVGYVAFGATGWFMPLRTKIAVWAALGWRWGWIVVLVPVAGHFAASSELKREAASGRSTGIELAKYLPDGCELWADGLIEARPETIRSASDEARRQHRAVRPRWVPLGVEPDWTPLAHGTRIFIVLRDDDIGNELAGVRAAQWRVGLREVARGAVYKYRFRLLEVDIRPDSSSDVGR